MPSDDLPLLLVCDHRGSGLGALLERRVAGLARIEVTTGVRASLTRAEELGSVVLVLDPFGRAGLKDLALLARTSLPLLLVVEEDGAPVRIDRARDAGAWDVIRREAPDEEWRLRIGMLLEVQRLRARMDSISHRASHDDLTDLLRPDAFREQFEAHFAAAHRHHHPLAFVFVDLDRFGQINKVHPYEVGNTVIADVGAAIRKSLRVEDVAGRPGGDEFWVLLPYTAPDDAARVVGRLRDRIHGLSGPREGAEGSLSISASIGFETFDGDDLVGPEELKSHAEESMKLAKASGGNRAVYYRELQKPDADAGAAGGESEAGP